MKTNIIIIGGGASGMMSAIFARKAGAEVTILERNAKMGKKLLVTGNGRCNYTNIFASKKNYNHPGFAAKALESFSPQMTIDFLEDMGIPPKVEEFGKTFPLSEEASSVVEVLQYQLEISGVKVVYNVTVKKIVKNQNCFQITGEDGSVFQADKVIVCTGGLAMPASGSDGIGIEMMRGLGHKITPVFPALVKLKLSCPYLKQLDGVKIQGTVQLWDGSSLLQEETGDILFTNYGISGPTILQLSRKANELLMQQKPVFLHLSLVNLLNQNEVEKRFVNAQNKPVAFSLVGLIHKKLIPPVLKEAGLFNPNALISTLSSTDLARLVSLLFDWRFEVLGSKGFEEAQVTAGGIETTEINPLTMESLLIPGLFFAGEIMDMDAMCGGYNLQWAWSSAFLAGNSAALAKDQSIFVKI